MEATMKIWKQTEAYIYNKKEPYIMEAILQEIRKVVIKAAGVREPYWIYIYIYMLGTPPQTYLGALFVRSDSKKSVRI